MITAKQLAQACACPLPRAQRWLGPVTETMALFAINTPARIAAFLAQVAHESGRLAYTRELWGPTTVQARYEGRADLGNVQTGDGHRYRGRGLIQTTGRANYAQTRNGLREFVPQAPDFEAAPELLEIPRWAALSAGWYWHSRGCNGLADSAQFTRLTRRINGGINGISDRLALWASAKVALA